MEHRIWGEINTAVKSKSLTQMQIARVVTYVRKFMDTVDDLRDIPRFVKDLKAKGVPIEITNKYTIRIEYEGFPWKDITHPYAIRDKDK